MPWRGRSQRTSGFHVHPRQDCYGAERNFDLPYFDLPFYARKGTSDPRSNSRKILRLNPGRAPPASLRAGDSRQVQSYRTGFAR